jgi:hypothetical protein
MRRDIMGDIKRQPAKQKPATGRIGLTAAREEWLCTGHSMLDWHEFGDLFEDEEHCQRLWEKYRGQLMARRFEHSWFGHDSAKEPGWRPWAWWEFEGPKEPRKKVFVPFPGAVNIQGWDEEEEPDLLYLQRLGLLEDWELEAFKALEPVERRRLGFYEVPEGLEDDLDA